MVYSENPDPSLDAFKELLNQGIQELSAQAEKKPKEYYKLHGTKLESKSYDILCEKAKGGPFENSIKLVSGQRFPDIVANNLFGVEIKSTKQDHWRTTGNSIFEGTRVEGIERIFMLFGKLADPIEFRCRPYEECLSEVVITHSPRYQVDMELSENQSIFEKMQVPYEKLRKEENPIKPIRAYYRKNLKEGQELWWLENKQSNQNNNVLTIFNRLEKPTQDSLLAQGFVLFTELFSSNPQTKYNRFSLWLTAKHNVVCHNVRDFFTSGGKKNIKIGSLELESMPKLFATLHKKRKLIRKALRSLDLEECSEKYETEISSRDELTKLWKTGLLKEASSNYSEEEVSGLKAILNNIFP